MVNRAFGRVLAVFVALSPACSDSSSDRPHGSPDAGADGDAKLDGASDRGPDAAVKGILAPGTIAESGTCDPGPIAGTTCSHLTVSCPNVADLGVSLRVTTPTGAPLATIALESGGSGSVYFEDSDAAHATLTNELVAAGFAVVRRSWDQPGWFEGSTGLHAASCRFGTLLRWIDEHYRHAPAPMCGLGVSGGAIEIAYALARWDGADRLASAILVSGPSISQLDVVCPSVATPNWLATACPALAAQYGLGYCGSSLLCTLAPDGAALAVDSAWAPNHPCAGVVDGGADAAAAGDPTALAADGPVAPGARLDYPATKLRMLMGGNECSVTPLVYYDAVQSDRALEIVPGASHGVIETSDGLTAARSAIKSACAPY